MDNGSMGTLTLFDIMGVYVYDSMGMRTYVCMTL